MKMTNSRGPRTDPWGTSLSTLHQLLLVSPITTRYFLHIRKDPTQSVNLKLYWFYSISKPKGFFSQKLFQVEIILFDHTSVVKKILTIPVWFDHWCIRLPSFQVSTYLLSKVHFIFKNENSSCFQIKILKKF